MSRFTDFDEFLRTQDSQKQQAKKEQTEKIKQTRKQLDPWIQEIFSAFKEYYETILLQRREYFLILKKREALETKKDQAMAMFLYRLNLIPREILPAAFDLSSRHQDNHLTMHMVTEHDWHFDVSFQFDVMLTYLPQSEIFTPEITLRVWGELPYDASKMLPASMHVAYKTAWRHHYTEMQIMGEPKQLQKEFEQTLMLLTPQILSHLEEVWKLKR